MLAWRAGGAVRLLKLEDDVDALDLAVYKRQFLSALERQETCEDDETRKPTYWLQKFEGLVKPILEISEPGDVLVFSPCGLLHGVPLHAIVTDGQPLIGRNPITYTTSMKSLFYAAVARATDTRRGEVSTFHSEVFGNPPSGQGRESVERVADILNLQSNTGADFNKEAFMNGLIKPVDLLHYHAHATAENGEPLEQALQFQDGLVTVEDILDTAPKSRSYHATILGCSSGVTVKTTSNEPLGLVPALMYNGASSVISALWPVDDHDAALFANEFYSDFARSHHGDDGLHQPQTRIINLALATQRAVLKILHSKDDRGALKHWAGFVLNGWWMLPLPEKRPKKQPPDLDKFPVMYSARPWPPPPPAPPVRIRSWWLMVPRWFSFYTLWPYFEW